LVGKAAALIKDETLSLIADGQEAKAPSKEGVSTYVKSVPLGPIKQPLGSSPMLPLARVQARSALNGSLPPKEPGSTLGGA